MADGQTCPNGHQVPGAALYCPQCGARPTSSVDPAAQHPVWSAPHQAWEQPQPQQQAWEQPQPPAWGAPRQVWQGSYPVAGSQPPAGPNRRGVVIASVFGAAVVVAAIVLAVALLTSGSPGHNNANGNNPPNTLGLGGASNHGYPSAVRNNFIGSCESAGSGAADSDTLSSYCTCVFDRLSASVPYAQFKQDEQANTDPPGFASIRSRCEAQSGLIGGQGSGG